MIRLFLYSQLRKNQKNEKDRYKRVKERISVELSKETKSMLNGLVTFANYELEKTSGGC